MAQVITAPMKSLLIALALLAGIASCSELEKGHQNYAASSLDARSTARIICQAQKSQHIDRYGESLDLLQRLLTTSNEDVCADAKVELVEQFHHKFVSKVRRITRLTKAPAPVKRFFMLYARQLAMICRMNALPNVDMLANTIVAKDAPESEKITWQNLLADFDLNFGQKFLSLELKDIFLFWNVIDTVAQYNHNNNGRIMHYFRTAEQVTPEDGFRVTIRAHNGESLVTARNHCLRYKRPLYARTILPVIRLADLGYFEDELNWHYREVFRNWYMIAQFCETILPIKVVNDPRVVPGQFFMMPKEQAAQLPPEEKPAEVDHPANAIELKLNSLTDHGLRPELFDVKKIKAQIKTRDQVIARFMVKLALRFKPDTKAKPKQKVFLSKYKERNDEEVAALIGHELGDLRKPGFIERAKDSLYKVLWRSVQVIPYLMLLVVSLVLIVAGSIISFFDKSDDSLHEV